MHISDNKMDMIIPAVIHAHSLLDEEAYQILGNTILKNHNMLDIQKYCQLSKMRML